MEYALNLNPRTNSSGQGPSASLSADKLALTFKRWKSPIDITYVVEVSNDLITWNEVTEVVGTPTDNGDDTETVTIRDNHLPAAIDKRFIRLKVTQN